MKTLYIHIGTGKTGTTAIQDILYKNKNFLYGYGVLYPVSGLVGKAHHGLCFNSYRGSSDYSKVKNNLRSLVREIEEFEGGAVIISSENFPGVTSKEVVEYIDLLKDVCDVKVLVYFRRPDYFLESWFSQLFKSGQVSLKISSLKLELYKKDILNYRLHVEKWIQEVGRSNVIVRPYQKSSFYEKDLLKDFFWSLGLIDVCDGLDLNLGDTNPSTSREQVELVKFIFNAFEGSLDGFDWKVLAKPTVFQSQENNSYLTYNERYELLKLTDSSIKWLSTSFNNGDCFFEGLSKEAETFSWPFFGLEYMKGFFREVETRLDPEIYELLVSGLFKYFVKFSYYKASEKNYQDAITSLKFAKELINSECKVLDIQIELCESLI